MTSLRASGVRRLSALFRQAREPVFLLDPQGRFAFVNASWEALTGRSAESVIGSPVHPDQGTIDPRSEALAAGFCPPPEAMAGRPSGGVSLIQGPAGERLRRRVEYWPYHDNQGGLLGLLGLVRQADCPPLAAESESLRARGEMADLREELRARFGFDDLIGRGPRHDRLLGQVRDAGAAAASVLIVGEPGTGRSLVALLVHRGGPRSEAPLISLDVAALSPEILGRELLANAPAADRPPPSAIVVEEALGMPRDLQAGVAEAIRSGSLRVLATTADDPEMALREDRLRDDYYFALTGLVIRLAPIRERLDELPMLAAHFLEKANRRGTRRRSGFEPEALDAMRRYDWPGNLAELRRVVESAHDRGPGDAIAADDLPAAIRGELASAYPPPPMPSPITPLDRWLTQLERRLIEQALHRARQNKSRAAEILAISRPRLYRRIKELEIPDEPEAPDPAPS